MAQAQKLIKQEWSDFHHPHISMCHSYILKHHSDYRSFVTYYGVLPHYKEDGHNHQADHGLACGHTP